MRHALKITPLIIFAAAAAARASAPQFDVTALPIPPKSTADAPAAISEDGIVLGGYSFIGDSSKSKRNL